MFETGVRQFRLALGMAFGWRLRPHLVVALAEDARRTMAEFGTPGDGVEEVLAGPFADPTQRAEFAIRSMRRTARALTDKSPFYSRLLGAAGVDPATLDLADLSAVPVTLKRDLIEHQRDFLCRDAQPAVATRTTGTTGRAAEVWMSNDELELWSAMSALAVVLRGFVGPTDVMQVHVSSRATAAVTMTTLICRRAGAGCRVLGVVPPDQALDSLLDGVTLMSASPSYLAELVLAATRRGLGAADFRLRRIDAGGEVLSAAVRAATEEMFGAVVEDGFGMTEVIPVTGTTCSRGHMHFDLNTGYVEVIDLDTGRAAVPGALGSVVITPYYQYRQCMPVFRYDTRDVVRCLDPVAQGCELAGMPGTGPILGKADQLLRASGHLITPRELVDAVEALPSRPWPARYTATVRDDRVRLTLPVGALAGLTEAAARAHFSERGLDLDLDLVPDEQGRSLRRVRSDLRELTFVTELSTVGG